MTRRTRALNGGGYLVNWGCYDLDYLLGITGWSLKPRQVLAQTWAVPPQFQSHVAPGSDVEAYYIALIRCEGGAVVSIERGEYMPLHSEDAWQVIGTKGSLTLKMTWGSPKAITQARSRCCDSAATCAAYADEIGLALPNLQRERAEAVRRHQIDPEVTLRLWLVQLTGMSLCRVEAMIASGTDKEAAPDHARPLAARGRGAAGVR